ncbi:MAG: ABC transporter ATP-binding protein [Acidobacteria bacterium]|nr:ABC transporter ATP-binding protein [Acidobacteriota bacterium]
MGRQREKSAVVVAEGLRKSYGQQVVLDGIDLRIGQGETVTVLGRSGTGKSVLLKLIIGLQKPDSGSIQVHGQEITELPPQELNQVRKRIGFLFQDSALYDSLTIEENVSFPLRRHNHLSLAEQNNRARELLASVGIDGHAHKMPSDISGGMKKRVGVARALALDPDILLFDEPTAGLDPITAGEIEELILKLQEKNGLASIIVTHDLHGAKAVSDRLALLHEGKIVIEGSFRDLEKSDDPFVSRFIGTKPA